DENLQPQPVLEPDFAGFAGVLSAYLKATERGDATAMSQLGDWYQSGRFMPKNSVEAFRWYDQAANGGLGGAAVKRDRLKPLLTPDERTQALKP
ncbi:MAG: hypothetical protein JWQ04_1513, partial [Pedosphaera sp.]|nr:hypothetical protein [Pedosphaera sp.]